MKARRAVPFWIAVVLSAAVVCLAAKEFVMPEARDARRYPAHDEHLQELVTVAADPYDTREKAAIFASDYREHDLLPIFIVVSNAGAEPVSFTDLDVQLVTARRAKISPATLDDLYRRMSRTPRTGSQPPTRAPLPMPLPGGRAPRKQAATMRGEFESAMFRAKAVEPHSSQAGFFFFDIQGIRQPLAGAHLYVSGLRDNNGQELMFFDIALDKYLAATK